MALPSTGKANSNADLGLSAVLAAIVIQVGAVRAFWKTKEETHHE